MATKVRRRSDGKIYLLLGVGYGMYKAMAMANTMHAMNPEIDEGEKGMVAVCDHSGSIQWFDYRKLEVIEIDGRRPEDLLAE